MDSDRDGVLTLAEVRQNMLSFGLEFTEQEVTVIIKTIDRNGDGVIDEQEYIQSIRETLETKNQYAELMGDLKNVKNPIVLAERNLDLEMKIKLIQSKLATEEKRFA